MKVKKLDDFRAHPPVLVCSASHAGSILRSTTRGSDVIAVLSISDPVGCKNHARVPVTGRRAMFLTFEDDLDAEVPSAPTVKDVEVILSFGRQYRQHFTGDRATAGKKVLIHCFAGHSRSSAAAAICYAQELGPGREVEAVNLANEAGVSGRVYPNSLMLRYADKILNRDGALVAACRPYLFNAAQIESYERNYMIATEERDARLMLAEHEQKMVELKALMAGLGLGTEFENHE